MNLAVGTLILFGLISLVIGILSKLIGISLLSPYIMKFSTYLIVSITSFSLALVIDRFGEK